MNKTPLSKSKSQSKKFAEVEKLAIGGITWRLSPGGLWVYGKHYVNSATALPEPSVPYEPVRYYLACHAIELLLKAYLSIQGSSLLEMAETKIGHNLDAILGEAEANGLDGLVLLSAAQKEEIVKATHYYAGKVFEYPAMGEAVVAYPKLPNIDVLLQTGKVLLDALEAPCKEAS